MTIPLAALLAGGCPTAQTPQTSDTPDVGDNATPATASALSFDRDETVQFDGTASSPTDIDVYKLGTLSPGDRVFVDVQAQTNNLDLVAAVFDSTETMFAYSDDRTPDSSDLNPLIDFVLRGGTGDYFLAITPLDGTNVSGPYSVTVRITRDVGIPPPTPQTVFLDWRGGQNIRVPNVGVFNLPAFDASQVGFASSLTKSLKARVQAIVEDRYKGFDILVQNSDDNAVPTGGHSTVYYGSNSQIAFAISEQIDPYDADQSDDSIVFTGAFRDAFFASAPTFEEMAQALGNTTAHEIGHLLGLVHTKNCNDLMDTTCGNSRILQPQVFSKAQLDTSVFPFGFQDAPQLLAWILGLSN